MAGPQHREFRKEILQTMQVGVGRRNKFCENIISVPLPPIFKYTLTAVKL
ncbi:TPA: nitrogen fixation protein NifR [Staphylococcus aureus]|nr:nitrogen fixation protein NifR [Staphylococcus aureus]MSN62429.1 nitrogen fixation protein NifR [Staphylococcus aureus]MSN64858.1 nitrogen fixation protein NifR [Staphylococcus aureus]MSN70238.1 nitrogen fixation protein NifR [Staphylococcus aureus]MSN78518.1 nitrogen fixation protein NifR [Staphylococcus aureus]